MTIKVVGCKFCGRKGFLIEQSKKIGSPILKIPCIYCNSRGWIRKDDGKDLNISSIKKEHENTKKE